MAQTNDLTLLILAAGMGSRYGGPKQLDGMGPHGECLMEYSIYDAIRSGFTKILFVIDRELEEIFTKRIFERWERTVAIDCLFQSMDRMPDGISTHSVRKRPWGTGHAILTAKGRVREPFVAINADDFYGLGAFKTIAREMAGTSPTSTLYSLVAYRLQNTLSHYGSVSRGLCTTADNRLCSIVELTEVASSRDRIVFSCGEERQPLKGDSLVSMNFWGFTPQIFDLLEREFFHFLRDSADSPSAEFYIAYPIDRGIKRNEIAVTVFSTDEKWMGVTYRKDREFVKQRLQRLATDGIYPPKLEDAVGIC